MILGIESLFLVGGVPKVTRDRRLFTGLGQTGVSTLRWTLDGVKILTDRLRVNFVDDLISSVTR